MKKMKLVSEENVRHGETMQWRGGYNEENEARFGGKCSPWIYLAFDFRAATMEKVRKMGRVESDKTLASIARTFHLVSRKKFQRCKWKKKHKEMKMWQQWEVWTFLCSSSKCALEWKKKRGSSMSIFQTQDCLCSTKTYHKPLEEGLRASKRNFQEQKKEYDRSTQQSWLQHVWKKQMKQDGPRCRQD